MARDRSRSITVPTISLHKSNIEQQHRPILDQLPADWIYDRDRYRLVSLLEHPVYTETLSELMVCRNRLSWRDDRAALVRAGRPGLAIQVEGAT